MTFQNYFAGQNMSLATEQLEGAIERFNTEYKSFNEVAKSQQQKQQELVELQGEIKGLQKLVELESSSDEPQPD